MHKTGRNIAHQPKKKNWIWVQLRMVSCECGKEKSGARPSHYWAKTPLQPETEAVWNY